MTDKERYVEYAEQWVNLVGEVLDSHPELDRATINDLSGSILTLIRKTWMAALKVEDKPKFRRNEEVDYYGPTVGHKTRFGYVVDKLVQYEDEVLICVPEEYEFFATWDNAKRLLKDLQLFGHYGWHLPSKAELNLMYKNLHKQGLGGFTDDYYWSSSGDGSSTVWIQGFSYGHQYDTNKGDYKCVRAVRWFTREELE